MAEPALRAAQASVISGGDIGQAMAGLLAARAREAQLTAAAQQRARQQEANRAMDAMKTLVSGIETNLAQGIPMSQTDLQFLSNFGPVGKKIGEVLQSRQEGPEFMRKSMTRELVTSKAEQVQALQQLRQLIPEVTQRGDVARQRGLPPSGTTSDLAASRALASARTQRQSAAQRVANIQEQRVASEEAIMAAPITGAEEFGAVNLNAAIAYRNSRTPEQLAAIEEQKQRNINIHKEDLSRRSTELRQARDLANRQKELKLKQELDRELLLNQTQQKLAVKQIRSDTKPGEGLIPVETGGGTLYVEPPTPDPLNYGKDFNRFADQLYDADTEDKLRHLRPDQVARVNQKIYTEQYSLQQAIGAGAAAAENAMLKTLPLSLSDEKGFDLYLDRRTGEQIEPTKVTLGEALESPHIVKRGEQVVKEMQDLRSGISLINSVTKIYNEVYGPGGAFETLGPGTRLVEAIQGIVARTLQTNPTLSAAERTLGGLLEKIARTFGQVRGAGTEFDVQRTRRAFGQLTGRPDSPQVAALLINNMFDAALGLMRTKLENPALESPLIQRPTFGGEDLSNISTEELMRMREQQQGQR